MKEKIIISYFKCDSHQGDELYRKTKHELEQRSIQGMDVEVVLRESDTLVGRDAFMCNDIVIFDASLEGEEVGQQYDALIEPMLYSEYVLIVSRTILPFNVFGTWKGGYPRYLQAGVANYRESLTNEEILLWLKKTLGKMKLPNPRKIPLVELQKLTVEERVKTLGARSRADYATEEMGFKQMLQVFVSYCSRYSDRFHDQSLRKGNYTVEDLIHYISKTKGIPNDKIGYFPPGKLSRELMTLQRRWEVVSETFKLIFACSEFWILDAPEYWESWWTLSERITLSYILSELPEYCPHIYIAKYDPKQGKFQVKAYVSLQEKRKLLPKLSRRALHTIRLYFANSRPSSIGYVRNSEYRRLAMKSCFDSLPGPDDWQEEYAITIAETMELMRPNWRKRPDTDSFWNDFILECPVCRQKAKHSRYSEQEFLYPQRNPFYHVIREENLHQTGQGIFCYTCPACGHRFHFRPESYYRWYPMGEKSVLGLLDAKLVERKKIYVFEIEKADTLQG